MFERISLLLATVALLGALNCGCQNTKNSGSAPVATVTPTVSGVYRITGGVASPGTRPLKPAETVSMALADNMPAMTEHPPLTLTLVRQCPEGKTRELINVNQAGHLLDVRQDYILRDGDELIMPAPTQTVPSITRPSDVPPRH